MATLIIVLLIAATAGQLNEEYRTAVNQAEILVSAMANSIDQHLAGSNRAVDGLLAEAVVAVEAGRWGTPEFADHLASRLGSFLRASLGGSIPAAASHSNILRSEV